MFLNLHYFFFVSPLAPSRSCSRRSLKQPSQLFQGLPANQTCSLTRILFPSFFLGQTQNKTTTSSPKMRLKLVWHRRCNPPPPEPLTVNDRQDRMVKMRVVGGEAWSLFCFGDGVS
ncbi:hypothetical protein V6N13_123372 [Hibiscus sabdariffa]